MKLNWIPDNATRISSMTGLLVFIRISGMTRGVASSATENQVY